MIAKPYAVWVSGNKWLGNMKRWQAYYLKFHLLVIMRLAGNKSAVTVKEEDDEDQQ